MPINGNQMKFKCIRMHFNTLGAFVMNHPLVGFRTNSDPNNMNVTPRVCHSIKCHPNVVKMPSECGKMPSECSQNVIQMWNNVIVVSKLHPVPHFRILLLETITSTFICLHFEKLPTTASGRQIKELLDKRLTTTRGVCISRCSVIFNSELKLRSAHIPGQIITSLPSDLLFASATTHVGSPQRVSFIQ